MHQVVAIKQCMWKKWLRIAVITKPATLHAGTYTRSRVTQHVVSCPDLTCPRRKVGLGTIEHSARSLRGVTVMTYAIIASAYVEIA